MVQCLRFRVPLRGGSIPGQGTKISHAQSVGRKKEGKKKNALNLIKLLGPGSKLRKEYVKAVYSHPAYLT